jgi:hypothetical protein
MPATTGFIYALVWKMPYQAGIIWRSKFGATELTGKPLVNKFRVGEVSRWAAAS